MNVLKLTAVAVAALALSAGAASAATIVNGSFEQSSIANIGAFTTLPSGSTAITGWTVGGDSVDYIGTYWAPSEGSRSIDMSGNGAGTLASQTFATVIGQAYEISFDMAGNPAGAPSTKSLDVNATGGATNTYTFDTTGHDLANMGWETKTYRFVATSANTTLTFLSNDNTAYGPALDNVSIASVPEPATWSMLILGFGMLGMGLRRRSAAALAA